MVVANGAVMQPLKPLWEISTLEWDTITAVNLTGVRLTVKHTVPHLLEGGSGSVILISSGDALNGSGYMTSYTAAKAGVRGLAQAAAK